MRFLWNKYGYLKVSNRSGTAYQHNLDELFAASDDSELSDFEGFVKECISKLAIKFTLTVSLMTTSGRTEIETTTPSRLPYNNIIMAGMAVVLRGWLPHRGEAQMAYNYCFPTRTMFSINSEFWRKGIFRWENLTSHLVRMKNSSYYIAPVGDWTHDLPHTEASNMVKVSHAHNHSATEAAFNRTPAQCWRFSHLWTVFHCRTSYHPCDRDQSLPVC